MHANAGADTHIAGSVLAPLAKCRHSCVVSATAHARNTIRLNLTHETTMYQDERDMTPGLERLESLEEATPVSNIFEVRGFFHYHAKSSSH
ncbi:hypothetical protein LSAT2_026040 [Lamellibrachia satsuma]|nr:hypothetical protein LSAT2_026040 [Lamellibrachia satsuma]